MQAPKAHRARRGALTGRLCWCHSRFLLPSMLAIHDCAFGPVHQKKATGSEAMLEKAIPPLLHPLFSALR